MNNYAANLHKRVHVPQVSSVYEDVIITDIRLLSNEDNQYFKANGTFQGPGIYFTYELNGKKFKWNYKILSTQSKNDKVKKYCLDLFSTIDPKNPTKFDNVLNNIFTEKLYKNIKWLNKFVKNPQKVMVALSNCSPKDKNETKDIILKTKSLLDIFNEKMNNEVVGKRTKVKVSSYTASSNRAKSPEDQDCLLKFAVSSYHQVNSVNQNSIKAVATTNLETPPNNVWLPSREDYDNFDVAPF